MQVWNLRIRLHVNMVCKWALVSIPGERDLPKPLNWCSRLEFRSHVQVHTHARTQASAGGGTPVLNVMAIRDQCHANVSEERMLLADADVALHHSSALTT